MSVLMKNEQIIAGLVPEEPSTGIYPAMFSTSATGSRYYAALPKLPINRAATLSRVNVLGVGDATLSNYTLVYDAPTGYAYISTTQNSEWNGKAVHVFIDFT